MKTYLDCVPCFFKQALEAARIAGAGRRKQKKILDELAGILPSLSLTASPPEMGRVIYGLVNGLTSRKDIYADIKEKSNKLAMSVYPGLKDKVERSSDRLLEAIELAIAGNVIDYGVKNSLDVDKEVKKILNEENKRIRKQKKRVFEYKKFRQALREAKTVLYLADNAGEIVFDRVLIEEIKRADTDKKIICAVKEKPIINDALVRDAYRCGIDKAAEIISSGSDAPGTVLSICSRKFLKIFKEADLVISKGQGNFEVLSGVQRPVFFLFMAKCPVVAREVNCAVGDIILLHHPGARKAGRRKK